MRLRHFRWWIAGLLLLAAVLNYVDRQTLSILAPTIQAELGMNDAEYGRVVSLFLAAYTAAYLVSGRIVDALGARVGMALFVGWWSLANMLAGLAQSAASLGAYRFLLGLGEAGGYTASPKVVAQWFPPRERGVAVGLYSAGGAIGATVAPVLVLALADRFGWRGAFVATGAAGLLFAALWFAVFRRPEEHPWLTEEERRTIAAGTDSAGTDAGGAAGGGAGEAAPLTEAARWRQILGSPAVWALMGARLLTDPVWYFFMFWMPKYLHSARGFGQRELAGTWAIYLAADAGFLASGFLSGYLIRRGAAPGEARLRTMLVCAALVPTAPLVVVSEGSAGVFAASAVVVLAHTAWLASLSTYVLDLVPGRLLGTAFGFIAAGSALGGMLMNEAVARVVARWSYDPCFFAMAALHPLAIGLLWRFARRPLGEARAPV